MNLDEPPTKIVKQEFLAVVFAGFGNELTPLTSHNGEDPCPKALLPIANRPMLDYPLMWLEASGIREVLLICPIPHRAAISHYLHSDSSVSSFPSLQIDLQAFDESQDLNIGTCKILNHFSSRIQKDFVVLPCDFLPPRGFLLSEMLNKFRTESTYDGSIATTCFFEADRSDKSASDEWASSPVSVPIMWDAKTESLLYIDTAGSMDKNGEEFEFSMSLLSRYPFAKLSASFLDSHVYVCKRSILDILPQKGHFDSIREELLPWLCTPQYHRARRAKYGHALSPISNTPSQEMAIRHGTLHSAEVSLFRTRTAEAEHTRDTSLTNHTHPSETDHDEVEVDATLRVGIVILRNSRGYSSRANTLHSYLESNRHFLAQTTYVLPSDPESRGLIDQRTTISNDSMVGHTTKVEERTTIKKSVIGKHCVIGKHVRITGCVILDHCMIADGAKLDGCMLGTNTKVGTKAELVRCVTQPGYEIGAGESFKNEKFEASDWTAPQESDAEEDSEESEFEN